LLCSLDLRVNRTRRRCFADEFPMEVQVSEGGYPSPIDLAATAAFDLGGSTVRPPSCEISNRLQTIRLEPRVMQVLVLLAQHHDEVVSRDDMIAACWRGMVVGEDAIQRCIGRLRKVTSTVGGFEVQTINRVGYRLRAVGGDTLPPEAAPVAA